MSTVRDCHHCMPQWLQALWQPEHALINSQTCPWVRCCHSAWSKTIRPWLTVPPIAMDITCSNDSFTGAVERCIFFQNPGQIWSTETESIWALMTLILFHEKYDFLFLKERPTILRPDSKQHTLFPGLDIQCRDPNTKWKSEDPCLKRRGKKIHN
jgi:hypothetical protein